MEIQFLGGAGEVGRSAFLLKDTKNILLDYGAKVSAGITPEFPLVPGRVDACVVSHAHFDHTGALPMLYNQYLPVTFGTKPTMELAELLIEDSFSISKKNNVRPKFSRTMVNNLMRKYVPYEYHSQIDFSEYAMTLYDAGHISGSAVTLIEKARSNRRFVYTGDFKIDPQTLQGSAEVVKSDILMIESTYATRSHPDRQKLVKSFVEDVKATVENGGTALVPCFAVGRAQEIVSILYQNGLIDCTYMDGMAKKAAEIMMRNPEFTKNKQLLLSAMKNANWIEEHGDRDAALSVPSVIVTTAGMLNGGPVLHYITKLGQNSKVFLTGYQVEGTNGRRLIEGKPLLIDERKYRISAPTNYYDFSAHASREDIYDYVRRSSPEQVICIHGDEANTTELAEQLKLEGYDAHAPKIGERLKVDF
ncbi:MAG: MBL fold metallo-hydrolase [Candidatus Micrarchaeota archaeon]|nr:MBL fold metallo-hydrolase [Candidatus Micrarchaeota archaeon]